MIVSQSEKNNIFFSVGLPAHNWEEKIDNTFGEIIRHLKTKDYRSEIIVANDGSMDYTRNITKTKSGKMGYKVKITYNKVCRGKEYPVKRGMTP